MKPAIAWGLAVCGAMTLFPPWDESPKLVVTGEVLEKTGACVEPVTTYAPAREAEIGRPTAPTWAPLWDKPATRYRGTTVAISWPLLALQMAAVMALAGILALGRGPGASPEAGPPAAPAPARAPTYAEREREKARQEKVAWLVVALVVGLA